MILNIRGTHGTGKTYISHKLIADYEGKPVIEPDECQGKRFIKPNAHILPNGLIIAGRYKSGMDGIFPQTIVEEMIEYWAPQGHVIWENVMVSGNIGRWAVLTHKLNSINHGVWAFMDTPLETCIERVFARRHEAAAAGFNHRQDDSEVKLDVLAAHWRRVRRAGARAFKEGIDVRWIDHKRSYQQVLGTLLGAGWSPPYLSEFPDTALDSWSPTEEELEYLLKTAKLPWEPEDTVTKVEFKSVPRPRKMPSNASSLDAGLGERVLRWGQDPNEVIEEAVEAVTPEPVTAQVFGIEIQKWGEADTLVTGVETTQEIL